MEYAVNDSKTIAPTSGWSLEIPKWERGIFIWQRIKVTYSAGDPSYTTPHCLESNIIDDVTNNIGEITFRDKTEILSGTEIFTDKADEGAVAHVEVDGKSYQHAGNGKNLAIGANTDKWKLYANASSINFDDDYKTIRAVKSATSTIFGIQQRDDLLDLEFGKQYTLSFEAKSSLPSMNYVYIMNAAGLSNQNIHGGSSLNSTTFTNVSWTFTANSVTGSSEKSSLMFSINTSSSVAGDWFEIKNIQLEENSTQTAYEPPAPSPDYPIEIHSLNDFDVVSSVGRENLAFSGFRNLNTKNFDLSVWAGVIYENSELRQIFEAGETYTFSYNTELIAKGTSPTVYSDSIGFILHSPSGGGVTFYADVGKSVGDKSSAIFTLSLPEIKDDMRLLAYTRRQTTNGAAPFTFDTFRFTNFKIEKGSEASPYSPASSYVSYDTPSPTLYKINLLLDEPLRSIGDIKDRLFRDSSDGLWKIERKVGEISNWEGTPFAFAQEETNGVYRFHYMGSEASNYKYDRNNTDGNYLKSSHFFVDSDLRPFNANKIYMNGSRLFHVSFDINNNYGITNDVSTVKEFFKSKGVKVLYQFLQSITETLPQPLQDKLNNLRSFKDSNYIYTVLPDKSDILSEKLKPTLHATFKSIAWANDFRYKFEQSKAMHATDIWFAKGVSNTIAPNIGWSTDAPVWEDGLYIWSKTITTYGDGRTEETSPVCITGATGRSVDKIEEWYYLSNKSDSLEGGTWSKTPPTWTDGKYIWTKNKIIYKNPSGSEETSPINTTGGSGQKGDSGTDAKTVRLGNIIHAVHFDQDGLMPSVSSIAFPTAIQGFSGLTPYYEFKMGDTIVRGLSTASSWTLNTSAMKYSDFPLTVSVNVVINGQTMATDTVTIVGTKPGEDAYTVVLANESHTFVGDVSNAIAGNTTANIIAYRGGTQVGATIGAISGLPTGMTSTIYSNGTTAARVTFTVTTSMTSPNGVVNIPVTVNGKSFTKVFNYAIAFKGAKGDKGTDGLAGKDGVGIRTTVLAYASSTSGTTTPSSGWQTTVPTVAAGNYLWTRTTWTYTDNSTEVGYTVSRIGKDGNTGKDGIAGKDGVGITKTVINYASSSSGTTAPTSGWATTVPSVAQGSYLWTRTTWTYTDGTNETGYSSARMGADGATGPQGVSITKVDVQYYLSTSSTALTGGSWSTTAPAWIDGRFMWSKTVTTYTSGSPTESKPVCITGAKGTTGSTGSTGATGRGVSSIVEQFYLSDSKTTQTGGSWSTTMPTWSPGKYVWTRSLITYTTGTPATSTTEPLVSSEWEAVNELEIGGTNLVDGSPSDWQSRGFVVGDWMSDLTTTIPISSMGLKAGDTITLSMELEAGSRAVATRIEFFKTDSERNQAGGNAIKNGTGISSLTATIPADRPYIIIRLQPDVAPVVTAYTIKYRRYKLEKGNKATDWSMSKNDYIKHVQDAQTDGQNYFHKSTNLMALTNMSQLGRDENTAPNGFTATGASTGPRSFRVGNVINSNGWWTVSGWFRGSQNTDIHFQMDINDGPQSQAFYAGTNNQWQYFEHTAYVSNYSSSYHFVDFNVGHWAYYFFKDVIVNKGDKAIPWRPAPEDVQSSIDEKSDSTATETALNEAAAKLQVLQQEVEAAATADELKNFVAQYNKEQEALNADKATSEKNLSDAMISIDAITNNMGEMSETWKFVDRSIRNTPQGIVIGNESSGSFIRINEQEIGFFSNGQRVAFVAQNVMQIDKGIFVEQIQVAKYQFEESTTNHLTIRYVG